MPSFSFSGLGPSVLRFPVVSLVLVDRSWFVLGVPDRVVDLLGVRCSRCGWFFFEVALGDLLFAELLHLEDMLFHSSDFRQQLLRQCCRQTCIAATVHLSL